VGALKREKGKERTVGIGRKEREGRNIVGGGKGKGKGEADNGEGEWGGGGIKSITDVVGIEEKSNGGGDKKGGT